MLTQFDNAFIRVYPHPTFYEMLARYTAMYHIMTIKLTTVVTILQKLCNHCGEVTRAWRCLKAHDSLFGVKSKKTLITFHAVTSSFCITTAVYSEIPRKMYYFSILKFVYSALRALKFKYSKAFLKVTMGEETVWSPGVSIPIFTWLNIFISSFLTKYIKWDSMRQAIKPITSCMHKIPSTFI